MLAQDPQWGIKQKIRFEATLNPNLLNPGHQQQVLLRSLVTCNFAGTTLPVSLHPFKEQLQGCLEAGRWQWSMACSSIHSPVRMHLLCRHGPAEALGMVFFMFETSGSSKASAFNNTFQPWPSMDACAISGPTYLTAHWISVFFV